LKKILIVDDEELIRITLKRIFKEDSYFIETSSSGNEAIDKFLETKFDLVLLDINLPDINGLDVLKSLKEIDSNTLIIIMTGYASIEDAVKAIKLGAYDYVEKPLKKSSIKLIVKLALETESLKKEVKLLQKDHFGVEFVGQSEVVKNVKRDIESIAKHGDATVLITGESGVGKELVAKSIHNLSHRRDKPFIAVNCASIPENLLESEFFGFERGAFTNAIYRKIGYLEEANGGTLFLDEIGDMDINMQSKLLRFIEEKSFRRIGSTKVINTDVRIICATNKDLLKMVESRKFRDDLYYRINVFPIHIPALRERKGDIILLAKYFIDLFNKKYNKNIVDIDEEAVECLTNYPWRGNVRELRNVVERVVIVNNDSIFSAKFLPLEMRQNFVQSQSELFENRAFKLNSNSLRKIESELSRSIINEALIKSGNNISKAARLLGVPRETLRDRIKKSPH